MSKNELQQELKAKIKLGIKPSDLKKNKTMPKIQDAYVTLLEKEKADLLSQVANYEKEQRIAVNTFKKQAQALDDKEKELEQKDQVISEKEENIAKLKTRIHELSQKLKDLNKTAKFTDEQETKELGTQTSGITPTELEEQLLEKRLENINDFGVYQEKLEQKEQTIEELETQIKKLLVQPDYNHKKVIVLTALLLVAGIFLLIK